MEHLREEVQFEVAKQMQVRLNPMLNESAMLGLAAIVALGGAWASLRNNVRAMINDKALQQFLEAQDSDKIIERQLPELLRRFKLVSNLSDLEMMETRFNSLMTQIDSMSSRVDSFVDTLPDSSMSSRFLAISPAVQKRDIKRKIKDFITITKAAFQQEMISKREALLS